MKGKKWFPLRSQLIGIAWISVVLLLIAGVAIFSPKKEVDRWGKESSDTIARVILDGKEDSVYRSKRKYTHYHADNAYHPRRMSPGKDSIRQATAPPPVRRQPLVVDLNTADTTTLMLLHGIGPTYARRIVTYRNRLGGYVDTRQLLEVYGFSEELLAHIQPHLVLTTDSIRRLDVNTIELKQLLRHPYIEYYQVRDIVRLRDRGVRFHSPDDLRAVPSMADSTLERMLPYLQFAQ